jgi:transcriptional regulator with XRE-family HTH domain
MSHRLENYLRTYRKRSGLSQDDIAFLLGSRSGTKVSRYERLVRRPTLKTLFAYEVIFRATARELFAGLYEKVEQTTLARARLLAERFARAKPNRMTSRKLATLKALPPATDTNLDKNP